MAETIKVDVTQITSELRSQMNTFRADIKKDMQKLVDESAEELRSKLRKSSPKRSRKQPYGSQWKVQVTTQATVYSKTVHNAKKYRLTHLLEKGTRTRYTTKGYHRGAGPVRGHIKQPTEETLEKFESGCAEIIRQHGGV